jgi:CIC family chloride channel protein
MPLIITSVVSFATIRTFEPYSIYTKRIAKDGELLTHDSDQAVLTLLKTSDLIEKDFKPVSPKGTLADVVNIISTSKRNLIPVVDEKGFLQGVVLLNDIREIMFNRELYNVLYVNRLMKEVPATVYCDDKMDVVMKKFETTGAWNLPVTTRDGLYKGFVSKSKIFSAYRDQLQQVSHE